MSTEFERAEQNVETRSESLKKPLGLFDLVLTQVLFVVGSTPEELAQFHKSEMEKWGPVIKEAGISVRE